jgi:hypothetical protein
LAALLCALYIYALGPVSGPGGGFFFLVTAWVIPDVVVLLLAVFVATLVPGRFVSRKLPVFCLAWLLLSLNTSLPAIARRWDGGNLHTEVLRRVAMDGERPVLNWRVKGDTSLPVFIDRFRPRVDVGGDEGCMCLYFVRSEATLYYERLLRALDDDVGARVRVNADPWTRGPIFEVRMTAETRDRASVDVDIYDGWERVASFHHGSIPFDPSDVGILAAAHRPRGRDRYAGLNNGYFWSSTWDMLLHSNRLSHVVGEGTSLFPEQQLRDFLARAVERRHSP